MRRFLWRVLNVWRREAPEQELAREIGAHLTLLEDELRRRGESPAEARRLARIAIGGVEQAKERQREARSFIWIQDLQRDLRYAARLLRRHPLFTCTAALSLAVGIGATSAMFTVANALLLREPEAVAEPDRLVEIGVTRGDGGVNPAPYRVFEDIRSRATLLAGIYAEALFPRAMSLGAGDRGAPRDRVFVQAVSGSYFPVLGGRASAGRLLEEADDVPSGGSRPAVLSRGLWLRRFGGDPAVVGRTLQLNDEPFTVVGVTAAGFTGTGLVAPDLWTPLAGGRPVKSNGPTTTDSPRGTVIIGARLRGGIAIRQAAAEMSAIATLIDREHPNEATPRGLSVLPASRSFGNGRLLAAFMTILTIVVGLVLAVACANVTGILLARGAARRRELAVRLVLGAGRRRLIRQLLTETLLLFLIAAAAGLWLARGMIAVFVAVVPALPFPVAIALPLDATVVAFTLTLSLAAALVSGLLPALATARPDATAFLRTDPHGPVTRSRMRSLLVVAQVACSLVVVITAGLFVRALREAGDVNPGFEPAGVEIAAVDLSMAPGRAAEGPVFWHEMVDRVRSLPDVQDATVARVVPGGLEGIGLGGLSVWGLEARAGQDAGPLSWNIVDPGYFATLRIPMIAGRDFTAADRPGTAPVLILDEAAARQLFPGEQAIGRLVTTDEDRRRGRTQPRQVVGVVRDLRTSSLVDGLAETYVYLPLQQMDYPDFISPMTIAARSRTGARLTDQIRGAITALDRGLVVAPQTLEESMALGLMPQRIVASTAGILGAAGVLLASIGIYGVTAYAVARRTREIGIRIALGASTRNVLGATTRQGLCLAAIGMATGLAAAAGIGELLRGFLFGIPPIDPMTFGSTAALFMVVGIVASYLPARRAARIDPLVALRDE